MRQEEAIRRVPLTEARMRQQEAAKTKDMSKPSAAAPTFRAPQKKSAPISRASVVGVERAYDPAKDPFHEDESGHDDGAAGGGGAAAAAGSLAKEATSLNPFGDCDDEEEGDEVVVAVAANVVRKPLDRNLNPFE